MNELEQKQSERTELKTKTDVAITRYESQTKSE